MPETLLKKRKSQEQARAARAEEVEKKKKVSSIYYFLVHGDPDYCDDNTNFATRPQVNAVASLTIFRG